jgi:hypothetical protein
MAIGLSSGFLEPLEANGVAVIVESLFALQDHWTPGRKPRPESVERFNNRVWSITEDIRDFLALHYRGKRRDTEFWRSHGEDAFRVPPSLTEKLEKWKPYYNAIGSEPIFSGYSSTAWMMVLQGLQVFDHAKLADRHHKVLDIGKAVLNRNTSKYKELVEPYWTLEEWINRTA